jgi:DNA-binding transcriptional MerR regulator
MGTATTYLKSSVVARQLGVAYSRLFALIREGKLVPPAKDSSGDYVWTEQDVEAARQALASRGRRRAQAPDAGRPGEAAVAG